MMKSTLVVHVVDDMHVLRSDGRGRKFWGSCCGHEISCLCLKEHCNGREQDVFYEEHERVYFSPSMVNGKRGFRRRQGLSSSHIMSAMGLSFFTHRMAVVDLFLDLRK